MPDNKTVRALMIRDTLPDKSGLYLVFGEDAPRWEEECNNLDCEGSGTCDNDTGLPVLKRCPACHGTGQRNFRLEGCVGVIPSGNCTCQYAVTLAEYYPELGGWLGSKYEQSGIPERDLMDKLIKLYRAGTLPPSLLHTSEGGTCEWGLRKVEVTE